MTAAPARVRARRPVVGTVDEVTLRLLADPLRARIIELLAAEQLCTCHLVAELGASQSNVSNHLRLLRDAGIVSSEPHGRFTYYRLESQALTALVEQLGGLADAAVAARDRRRPC